MIPCKECLVLAACKHKSVIDCIEFFFWIVSRGTSKHSLEITKEHLGKNIETISYYPQNKIRLFRKKISIGN